MKIFFVSLAFSIFSLIFGSSIALSFEMRSVEIVLGEERGRYIKETLISLTDIEAYGFNTVTVSANCGLTERGTDAKWLQGYGNQRLAEKIKQSLIHGCYLPEIPGLMIEGEPAKRADALTVYAETAHSLGLKFNFKPMVLEHTKTFGFNGLSEKSFWFGEEKFQGYAESMVAIAAKAEALKIEYFTVGTELTNLNTKILHSQEWNKFLNDIRRVYSGKIIYAHNVGPEGSIKDLRKLGSLWSKFDFIGANVYPSNLMAGKKDYSSEEVAAALKKARLDNHNILDSLAYASKKSDRPIILTEVSFPSWKGAANWMFRHHCDRNNEGKTDWLFTVGPMQPKISDLSEQTRLARAWWQVFSDKPYISGAVHVFWTHASERAWEHVRDNLNARNREKRLKKRSDDNECSGNFWRRDTGLKQYLKQVYDGID